MANAPVHITGQTARLTKPQPPTPPPPKQKD